MLNATKAAQTGEGNFEAQVLGFDSIEEMLDHQAWLEKHGSREFKASMIKLSSEVRPLNEAEIIRLESAIENEEKCLSNGTIFSEYDILEEGRWIMGCGQYRTSYLETVAAASGLVT